MKLPFICIMALVCHDTFSQFIGANWVFGDSAGLNFYTESPEYFYSSITTLQSAASISDETGNLLFYTNGAKVWNSDHNLMTLGDHLDIGGILYPLTSETQVAIILPDPGNSDEYYIFHRDNFDLKYSKVDISLSDGMGSVYSRNNLITTIPNITSKMQAVRHGNGRDWWLAIHTFPEGGDKDYGNPYLFYLFLVSPTGISEPIVQNGYIYVDQNCFVDNGQMKFSKNGDRLAISNGKSILLYDFNRCNGDISNFNSIDSIIGGDAYVYIIGLEFSPDGRKLYTANFAQNFGRIIQYSITSDDIELTKEIIYNRLSDYEGKNLAFSNFQLGIDDKIYITMPYSGTIYFDSIPQNLNLSVINSPNENGTLCEYENLNIWLGGRRVTYALPNMPNYNLGPLLQSECDTLSTSLTSINYNSSFTIAPNPAQEMFYIKTKQNTGAVFTLRIINTQGAESMYVPQYIPGSTVSVSLLPEGMYAVLLTDEKGLLHQQKLIISR